MTGRRPLVAANWKMNGTLASLQPLASRIVEGVKSGCTAEVAICAPFPYLRDLEAVLSGTQVALGAQTVSEHLCGAYTGEVSAAMLNDYNCRFVIVGHSERRILFHESDDDIARKFLVAADSGLIPILCVGEQLDEREARLTQEVVARQFDRVVDVAGMERLARAVIAYEPVWAIGTGSNATPEQAQAVHAFIRQRIAGHDAGVAGAMRILYGGSIHGDNAGALFAMADVDGGLVGGASLDAEEFLTICRAAR